MNRLTSDVSTTAKNRRAYVFYATNDTYAVAVLVFVRLLQRIGVRADTDLVVLHLPLSRSLVAKMQAIGIVTRLVSELRYVHGWHYRDCLVKLRVFELNDYDRVVYIDADAIPLKSLDYLFTLSFTEPVAAPIAYWLPQPFWGSHLLVVKPSAELWKRVRRHFASASAKRYYDMDIVNVEFAGGIHTLPAEVVCLNSEWEDVNQSSFFDDPDKAYAKVSVVHFSALGKPWSYSPEKVRRLRPNAHPVFYHLWETWWQTREEIFRESPLRVRINLVVLKFLCQRVKLRRFMNKFGCRLL